MRGSSDPLFFHYNIPGKNMSKKIEPPERSHLIELYFKKGTSISKLAKQFNTSNSTVRKWLIDYDIERKSHKRICEEVCDVNRVTKPNRQVLLHLYDNLTIKELEREFNCGQETIYSWLDDYRIPRKSLSEKVKLGKQKQHASIQFDKEIVKKTYEKFNHLQLTADELGVSVSYLRKLKTQYEIKTNIPWRSKGEIELYEFIKMFDPDCEHSNRSLINPFELDIVSHKHKLAIEYCGLYWHSEYYGQKTKTYHREKYIKCKEKGYTLLTIFESDNIEKVKRLIISKIDAKKIGARKTKVIEIASSIARKFHEKYHLHNTIGGSHHYGLIYGHDIVSVMSFHKSRFNKKYEYECGRFTVGDINVIGGASKLFKHFAREVQPRSIITYSDLRFGDGNCYKYCGFKRISDSAPNYWYFHKNNPNRLYSRVKFQKHKLRTQLMVFDEEKTEFENMLSNKYDRIWDCGNAVYVADCY